MRRFTNVFLSVLIGFAFAHSTNAQSDSLQPGSAVERTLASGQRHTFTINLEQDQFLEFVIEQHGIDVIVRVFSPEGKSLGEFDSPNGTEGPENVSLTSASAGVYRIEVAPLGQFENVPTGRYEIKIVELRRATEQELQAGKNQEILKARGLALLAELADGFSQIRLPQTRVRAQLLAAQLLWPMNEKLAAKLGGDAIEGVREYLAGVDSTEQDYYQRYEITMQLRQEVVQTLGPNDPETALSFLRSTRTLTNPDVSQSWDRELALEVSLANQIGAKDPKRAAQIAEESLKKGYSAMLLEIVARLRASEPELASQLAKQIAAKLQSEKLLKNQEAANLSVGLLRLVKSSFRIQSSQNPRPPSKADVPLLSDREYKDLFDKTLNEALAYKDQATSSYSPERNSAQNILTTLKPMAAEQPGYSPASMAAAEKLLVELQVFPNPESARWQKYQEKVNTLSLDESLEEVGRAPKEMRDNLYQQVAHKALAAGDTARARQIVTEHVSPNQRPQVLANIDQQAIRMAASNGKIEEALRGISNLRSPRERAMMLSQIVGQIGPGQKRTVALSLLEQARTLAGTSARAESQEQMMALLEVARGFARYDPKRAFEIVEPLLDQFNEMAAAAQVLNGFGQDFYEEGELAMQNGSSLANFGNQLIQTLGILATANFDRAKAGAERLERPEIRLIAKLAIAQQAIGTEDGRRSGRRSFRE